MARIPEDQIERLKKEISLERLVQSHGIELKAHGKNLIGRCPWHDDKTPSLVITPSTNLWNCLGKCSTGGSVFDWVMKAQGVSFLHAFEILKSGQIPDAPERPVKSTSIRKLPAPLDFSADDRDLYRQVVEYYHRTLLDHPTALDYLASRGIKSREIIERFQIGFANRTLGLRLPHMNVAAGAKIRQQLQDLGIYRESGHEHFNGSIIVPVFDENGDVLEMYGRKITRGLRPGTPDHLYLPGPRRRGVFNIRAVAQYPEIILCEAIIDALTFLDAGFPNVTTAYGVNGFTPELVEAFGRYQTKRVLIAYDRDDAGEAAAEDHARQLMAAGIECFRIQFPRGMDANEFARKVSPAAKSLELVIRKAEWMGKGTAPRREPVAPNAAPTAIRPPVRPAPPALPHAERAPEPPTPPAVPAPVPVKLAIAAPPQPAAPPPPPNAQPLLRPASAMPPALPASPVPAAAPQLPVAQRQGENILVARGDRAYRIREILAGGQRKLDIEVTRGDACYQDKLDIATARHRAGYAQAAALELGLAEDTVKKDLEVIRKSLDALRERELTEELETKRRATTPAPGAREAALELLRDPRLIERLLEDFRLCGVVGEETNLIVGILAAVSRLLDRPMAVVIQSSSAAGKSSLMDAVLSFLPAEVQLKYSAMTGQSLFYMGQVSLKNKVLAIAEEEGAERASYALKLLQSEGELTIASTGKDPATGRHVTQEYHVEGPVMIFLTTTAVDLDEELLNRCVVLTVNETREQTRVIHQMQRERQTIEGQLQARDGQRVRVLHQNAQRLLRPMRVNNPFARKLTFRDDQTRLRRDHNKYLTLIAAIALLHQHQRPLKTRDHRGELIEYIDVTREDIRQANRLAHEVLGRTLDELPPQTRLVLTRLEAWVRDQCAQLELARTDFRFQRLDVRRITGQSEPRARHHLERLVALEYVLVHRGTRGQSFVYELVYDGQGQDGDTFLMGLIDPNTLGAADTYDAKFVGSGPEFVGSGLEFAAPSSPHRLPIVGGSSPAATPLEPAPDPGSNGVSAKKAENAVPRDPSSARRTTATAVPHSAGDPDDEEAAA